jgi:PAS domain S-box-containing protein
MTKSINQGSSKRLHIDKKMTAILSVFAVLGICLVVSIVIATNTLSGLRGFATLQANWTEARKEASLQLANYIQTGDEMYFARIDSALKPIHGAQEIRRELLKEDSDYSAIRSNFLAIHSIPEDVDNMITTFEYFHNFSDFREAIRQWIKSDQLIEKMEALAADSRSQKEDGSFNSETKQSLLATLFSVDREMTRVQYDLAAALSSGTRFLNKVILWVSSSLGFILLVTGGFLAFRFSKSLKNWRREILMSEQRYRSLFDQNPNGVYSMTKDGQILQGNEVLEKMTGYSLSELEGEYFANFIDASELDKMWAHFQKAVEGTPQTYETRGIRKNGEYLYAEITNLPIYVDEEINGVYGIAQDITDRKKAEIKIKEQLEEKTHLLAEVHDRVKNNLALISSLIQLQQQTIDSEKEAASLESTVSRIHSMAMVHERLYHTETFSSIRIDDYIRERSNSLEASYENTKVRRDTAKITLSLKQAIPTALLLNELLTNACKFSSLNGREGLVKVTLFLENNQVVLKVADNGPGLPEEYKLEESETLGLQLIQVLIKQLEASYTVDRGNGTTFTIKFGNEQMISKTA